MTRVFVSLKEFDTLWKSIGLDDGDLREVETFLITNPKYGKVISGTGGLRKMRWALPGKGKSGGIRILYVDYPLHEVLYFISLLKKNETENISAEDKRTISKIIETIDNVLKKTQ
ncbi:MAG TPA: type II toxin-antitoxin system RelE/ParE family toxin [Leptospiraceae bacterium]|nr:type II toxin-antitoxin system RelE/ParE family toxin [Leptospiraceae bacterium]HMW07674.1 type II toxin-antitoxin system RelE/ParE family toxin [Leptospiraceae bacterium]HMX33808.1 type II toxin-antitoxin system RelE/ParE family toxin [Leptospiraceae bacterium]HMY33312.1 type II toxin-antitoxin system RelE/ParE family toxin [Leptospiraceae bacterium]HMZ63049.1 type II toxin-antitoxin system RelE/ParE family toxin [Leptospiraceae bacterium]